MIEVKIGNQEFRSLSELSTHEIAQQVNLRRRDGIDVCVRIRIKTNDLDFTLSTPTGVRGGGRPARPAEQPILDRWSSKNLNACDFSVGNLVSFLEWLKKHI